MGDHHFPMPDLEDLLSLDASGSLTHVMENISRLQNAAYQLVTNEDSAKLDALKIGTVFQIFFIDVLASGKRPQDLTEEDWKGIAEKVCRYAVMEEGQRYSEFVFGLYADYIDISAETLRAAVRDEKVESIHVLADTIRENGNALAKEELKEPLYIEANLWLSLEAMIKLLSLSLAYVTGPEYAELAQNISQLAFEYGRYVLYAKEQMILEEYLQKQRVLDDELEQKYNAFLKEAQKQAEYFEGLVDHAFSGNLHEALVSSAELARAAGVRDEEILETVEDVDEFFM